MKQGWDSIKITTIPTTRVPPNCQNPTLINRQPMLSTKLSVIYIAIRVAIANKAPITDCDEVFNYWEPVHFLFQGHGMQTWEVSP